MDPNVITAIVGVVAILLTIIGTVASGVWYLGNKINDLGGDLKALTARVDGLQSEFNARMDGMQSEFNARIDGMQSEFNSRLGNVEREVHGINELLRRPPQ